MSKSKTGISGFHWNKSRSVIVSGKGFNREFYREVGNICRMEMNDFVPWDSKRESGNHMADLVTVAPTNHSVSIQYRAPYSHVQYYGEAFNHDKSTHPLATSFWDKAAWATRKGDIMYRINKARRKHAYD